MASPIPAGLSHTTTPASRSAAIFASAVPLAPGDDRAGVAHRFVPGARSARR